MAHSDGLSVGNWLPADLQAEMSISLAWFDILVKPVSFLGITKLS